MSESQKPELELVIEENVDQTNDLAILFDYLKNQGVAADSKVLEAISAYWLPLAEKWAGEKDPVRLQQIANQSINKIRWQIQNLRELANLLPPSSFKGEEQKIFDNNYYDLNSLFQVLGIDNQID
jgi:hypothetical protein